MKRFIVFLGFVTVFLITCTSYATDVGDSRITCNATVTGQSINISGCIENVAKAHEVALLVGDLDEILYIDQMTTDAEGNFNFSFRLAENIESGNYSYKIGSNANTEPYSGILSYTTYDDIVPHIEAKHTITDRNISISGQAIKVESLTQLTLTVYDGANVIHTEQTASGEDGAFSFNFALPATLPSGSYTYTIESNADIHSYTGTIEYTAVIEKQFVDGNIIVNISNFVPSISGTINCAEGKTATLKITNLSDNTIIAEDIITSADGTHSVAYTLPTLLTGKDYMVDVQCTDGNSTLCVANMNIDSSVLLVSLEGTAQVAENVRLDMQLKTTDSDLIDKNISITSSQSFSGTIPNLVANMSCDLALRGFETVEIKRPNFLITKNEKFKIDWFYVSTVEQFYSAAGNLYKFEAGTETKILENVEAKFIVSDENYVYFSNMLNDGRIYRCTKDGENLTIICDNNASWLNIRNGSLYYIDNIDNRTEKQLIVQ